MKEALSKIFRVIKKVLERKHYVEFITATLSIPVLLTVILLNVNNLRQNDKKQTNPQPTQIKEIIRESTPEKELSPSIVPSSTSSACKKEIGPISIVSPKEGETITENPVNFIIRYEGESFCSVVWSYRINNASWSEYSSNSPSIYNMPNGNVKFELRVQSTVSNQQSTLQRNFIYQGNTVSPTPSNTPTPTPKQ